MTAFLGIKMLRSKLADRVYILPERVYLYREGQPLTKADDYWEHAVHVITMRGERSAIKRNDWVERPDFSFGLKVLNDGLIKPALLAELLKYGGTHGLMAERGLGHGRYDFTLSELTTEDWVKQYAHEDTNL